VIAVWILLQVSVAVLLVSERARASECERVNACVREEYPHHDRCLDPPARRRRRAAGHRALTLSPTFR
jgi:hypothetical protein